MNIVNKLTLRGLKENKRRTLVTIIGVIISVAMITAVSTLVVSFMDLLQRQAIAGNGEWHVLYKNVNKEQLEAIKKDEETDNVIISRDVGYAFLEGSQNKQKPYLFVKEYNRTGFQQFPIDLIEGRLPKTPDEVVISRHIADNAKVQLNIGDTLTIEVGERFVSEENSEQDLNQSFALREMNGKNIETLINTEKRTYKITGLIERPNWEPIYAPGYTIISYIDESLITENKPVNASVVLKNIDRSIFSHAEEIGDKLNIEEAQFNKELLRYYGVVNDDNFNRTIVSLAGILMIVIIIGSVSLIYNAFAISVSERSRHLGMLASVGATKKQKRNSVFFEGSVIGVISIPIGIGAGITGIGITLIYIRSLLDRALGLEEQLTVVVTPSSIIAAIIVSAVTIFISTFLPAIKASKISAIDAIRQTKDVKLTRKKVKTSRLVRKLFGIEAEISLKNLKRNKRRYQATVFSLAISIVLFLAVSYFTENLQKSYELTQFGPNYDISVDMPVENDLSEPPVFENISGLEDVTAYTIMQSLNVQFYAEKAYLPNEMKEWLREVPGLLENGKFPYSINLYALSDESLKTYTNQIGISYEKLTEEGKLPAIVIDVNSYQDGNTGKFVESKAINAEIGQTLDLQYANQETGEITSLDKIEIAAFTDQLPMGVLPQTPLGTLNVIISANVLNQLIADKEIDMLYYNLYLSSSNPMKTEQEIEKMQTTNLINVYNPYESRQQGKQLATVLAVFVYGFIALITAITVANIFNTISTSIALRKREFAMLKSVGMTPKSFNKMINYESIFYGMKSLLYGLPISIIVMLLMYRALQNSFVYQFELPWKSMAVVIAAVFIIVGSAMLYSASKVKKENIIDTLKQESI